jgi:hypothetical protein
MSERPNVVLVPTPRTPGSALSIQIEFEKEPREPWETTLFDTLERTLEEIIKLRAQLLAGLFGASPAMNLPPAPTALSHILTALASQAKTIATVVESQIANLEKRQDKEEMAKFVSRVIEVGYRSYSAFGMVIAEYTSTVVHGLVNVSGTNLLAILELTGLAAFKEGGEVAVQQERR